MNRRARLIETLRRCCRPLNPEPTHVAPRLEALRGIEAVLFDVYGTLFVSGSGDVGVQAASVQAAALQEAMENAGLRGDLDRASQEGARRLLESIARSQARGRAEGREHPEVEIRRVWEDVIGELVDLGFVAGGALVGRSLPVEAVEVMAIEYECRVNPVWPMPGALATVQEVIAGGRVGGIVSNAQFFTPLLFDALLGRSLEELGLAETLCEWSFESLEAKPSVRLFERVLSRLKELHGIAPEGVLYVGNDQRNDVWPAARCGCRTALFAGDRRSLRLREDDEACRDVKPDVVITDLSQLLGVLGR